MTTIKPFITSMLNRLRIFSRIDPARDWIALIALAGMAFGVIVVWNAWAFDTVANGGVIGSTPIVTTPTFDKSSLNTVRDIFANRASEEQKYVAGVYRFADPSQ